MGCGVNRDGSYPSVQSHSGEWTLNPSSHSLTWSLSKISYEDDTKSGSIIFSVGGDDPGAFFPVDVAFVAQGSMGGVNVASVSKTDGSGDVEYSVDSVLTVDDFSVV
jgi:coatomer subunit delta